MTDRRYTDAELAQMARSRPAQWRNAYIVRQPVVPVTRNFAPLWIAVAYCGGMVGLVLFVGRTLGWW